MRYSLYLDSYSEFLKLMSHLGPYIAIGFKDLSSKAEAMRQNRVLMQSNYNFITKEDKEYKYICKFVQYEIKLGIHEMNINKNEKIFNNLIKSNSQTYSNQNKIEESMRDDLENYQSTSRTLLRGAWFF